MKIDVKTGWRARSIWSELLAEFIGTFVLLAFGAGVVAVAVVGLPESGRTPVIFAGAGDWLLITWGWAMAVTMAVYVAGGVTGAHLNPAVSVAFAIKGDFPWAKVLPYSGAQIAGAFAGAALVYADYAPAIDLWNGAHGVISRAGTGGMTTFSIFATFPAHYYGTSLTGPLFDQIIGTFFLILFVLAIVDSANMAVKANLGPFMVGMAVAAIGMSFGTGSGYAINPARDLGPRLFCWLMGWGSHAFPGTDGYWWVPIVGPMVGSIAGVTAYKLCIGDTLAARGAQAASAQEPGLPPAQDPGAIRASGDAPQL
ncbi:MAG TPA: MIP family channel protein [Steroidobacteraceae bacterium]|nr:MIP family channel protein [Steroidobacteraceae bacterium]